MGKRQFAPTRHRGPKQLGPQISIYCRAVACGGTTVEMFPTAEGIRCVWRNEETDSSDDYVSIISWEEWRSLSSHDPQRHEAKHKR